MKHLSTIISNKIEQVLENYDFERVIDTAMENIDIEEMIEEALDDFFDFSEAIEDVLTTKIAEEIQSQLEGIDLNEYVEDLII